MQESRINKRKIILINKRFQYKLILKFIAVNILILCIFGAFMYIFTNSEIDKNLFTAHVTYKNMKQMILPIIITLSVINIIVSSIIIFIFVLYSSHKLAGPLFRFNAVLDNLRAKDFTGNTRLREGDQFTEISDSIQKLTDVISTDIRSLKVEIAQVANIMSGTGGNDALKPHLDNIARIIASYKA